jgi:hypothetical protein
MTRSLKRRMATVEPVDDHGFKSITAVIRQRCSESAARFQRSGAGPLLGHMYTIIDRVCQAEFLSQDLPGFSARARSRGAIMMSPIDQFLAWRCG